MKNLLKALIPALCLVATVSVANAQTCSTTDKATLKTCVDTGVLSCRIATAACNDFEPVLTIDDVQTLAVETCCGKKTKTARSLCLTKESAKYLPEVASGDQKTFFRAARAKVKEVKNTLCKNTTYSFPESSALF